MTGEDAITIFKRQKKLCLHKNDWFHALEMAIEALEQEPDAIYNEREDESKLLEEYYEYCKHDGKKMYHLPFIIWLKQVKKIKEESEITDADSNYDI